MNVRGERCGSLAGSDGLCSAHRDPERMRELGHRGGKARRKGVAEQLPAGERESLRQHLRANLDHLTVLGAVQRSLEGGNESARVAAVKFLADLELYRKDADDGLCPRCAGEPYVLDNDVTAEEAATVLEMLEECGVFDWKIEQLAQRRAEELTRAFREEHGLPAPPPVAA